ncbi:hypothetical protein V8Q34_09140 [Blautia sp. JLR.GB0024]|uniref:hypothetical protein n=1 Tax=Blautia sp. JLR.GB0024 TaxID=3123295 RepID=UPI003007EE6D
MIEFFRRGALNSQYVLHVTKEDTQPLSDRFLHCFWRKVFQYNKEYGYDHIRKDFK